MYRILFDKQAAKDAKKLKSVRLDSKAKKLIEIIKRNTINRLRREGISYDEINNITSQLNKDVLLKPPDLDEEQGRASFNG